MCGIVGQIRFDGTPVDRAFIERMNTAIAHRGPDGDGVHVRDNVGLGHRRLAIIDLESGAQPMTTADGQVWVTYNGEIYNFKELRSELESCGHSFRTHSDTEVLLHAWREWGEAMVPKLRGMFAFCIVDYSKRQWLIARDPFGIKPLCYRLTDTGIEFSSELHAIESTDGRLEAIEWFLRYQYIPAPYTVFRDVWKLPPAHCLTGDFDGVHGEPKRYWQMKFDEQKGVSEDEWIERFDAAIQESVEAHLVSDVPVGLLLSGGVDSTLVAREMAKLTGKTVKAFTMDFDIEGFGELEYARKAAAKYGVELIHDTQRSDFWDELPDLVRHYGEPFGDNSMIPTWSVTRLARQHVPVVLGGDGGDEAFGGYRHYRRWLQRPTVGTETRALLRRPRLGTAKRLARAALSAVTGEGDRLADWHANIAYTPSSERNALWGNAGDETCPAFASASDEVADDSLLNYAQRMDFATYLPGAILTKSDIASMYHSVEVRTPFLDYRVLELASEVPESLRVDSSARPARLKVVLRRALEPDFDREFVWRRKKGFGGPREHWFYSGAVGRDLLGDLLADMSLAWRDWFDLDRVRVWLSEHSPETNRSPMLWLLLVLGLWLRANPQVKFS